MSGGGALGWAVIGRWSVRVTCDGPVIDREDPVAGPTPARNAQHLPAIEASVEAGAQGGVPRISF
jgi:hypothetical protein